MPQLILASGSPRRKQLLDQVNLSFTVKIPNVDEESLKLTNPVEMVKQLAMMKGEAIQPEHDQVILSADTIVSYKDQILTKPTDKYQAHDMLSTLRGDTHTVYTGVMIHSRYKRVVFTNETNVSFWDVSDQELDNYIQSEEWRDKAAGYGIQAKGAFLVKEIHGDYYNVVGLPISTVVKRLKQFDIYPVFASDS